MATLLAIDKDVIGNGYNAVGSVTITSPVSCLVGDTSCTIINTSILTTSTIEYFAQNTSGDVTVINNISVTTGQAVLSFDALTEATSFYLRITNY